MTDIDIKLQRAKPILLFAGLAILGTVAFFVDNKSAPVVIPTVHNGKTIEEIMHGPVPKTSEPTWDKTFKSAIIPVKK